MRSDHDRCFPRTMPASRWVSPLLALAMCLLVLLSAGEATRPNVLVVLVDDAGYGDFGCHGHPFLKTPHIDRLHAESVRFTDFHAAPMCSPTRAQLLTGCHGLRTGVTSVTAGRTFIRRGFPTIAEMFAAAGWRTGLFGKWHLGDNHPHRPMDRGFDEVVWGRGWGFTSAPEFANTLIDGTLLRGIQEERFRGYITDVCFDEAMRFMQDSRQQDRPFLCLLPLHAAHAPHIVPSEFSEPYAAGPAASFFGMLANLDANMGRLDRFLTGSGLRDDTIVVFLTDNGGTAGVKVFNAGLRGHKTTYYEGGHRVPCFIRWPRGGFGMARDIDALTQVQDLAPTLLELCGIPRLSGPGFDGISLEPLLRGGGNLPDRTLVVQYGPGAGEKDTSGPKEHRAAVLWRQWRLVHGTELYDVVADRAQERDVAADHPQIVERLRADYAQWWTTVRDHLRDFVPVVVGSPREPVVELTSSDWQDTYADNARHIREGIGGPRGGPWNIEVERAGLYDIELHRWPFTIGIPLDGNVAPPGRAMPIRAVTLMAGGTITRLAVPPGSAPAVLQVRLPSGRTQIHAWFQAEDGADLCGAYFARVVWRAP
jgi:arylsulfatase A-like enzyme